MTGRDRICTPAAADAAALRRCSAAICCRRCAGATVPLTGFGYSLAKGVAKAVAEDGLLGVLTGGLTATSGGIAAAVVFSLLAALLVRAKEKR